MRRFPWIPLLVLFGGCGPCAEPAPASSTPPAATSVAATTDASSLPPVASSAPSTVSSADPASDDGFGKHSAAALVSECIDRSWLGYTCNNAYAAASRRFPQEAAAIRSLMRLAVRADAGKPLGGEAEVTSFCVPEKGEGGAYACLYVAEGNKTPRGKAAHALACKGAPPEGQVPIAGGSAACDGDKPVQILPLPKAQALEVKRCLACGHDPALSSRELSEQASAKACAALRKRLGAAEAAFVDKSIAPLCPSGS